MYYYDHIEPSAFNLRLLLPVRGYPCVVRETKERRSGKVCLFVFLSFYGLWLVFLVSLFILQVWVYQVYHIIPTKSSIIIAAVFNIQPTIMHHENDLIHCRAVYTHIPDTIIKRYYLILRIHTAAAMLCIGTQGTTKQRTSHIDSNQPHTAVHSAVYRLPTGPRWYYSSTKYLYNRCVNIPEV